MSISSQQDAFEQFERKHVRVPEAENADAKKVEAEFRAALEEALGDIYAASFLAGSYRRKTQAVHLKDLDIILVLNDPTGKFRASAKATLVYLKDVVTVYDPVTTRRVKCRAVECELDGYTFWADIVPALVDTDGGLLLAYNNEEEGVDEWRPAGPKGQTQACSDKNAATDGAYVPVTRICKFWNGSFTSSPSQEKPVPSYWVESVLHNALDAPCDWPTAVVAFFENAQRHLSSPWPTVPCPGDPENYVDEKLDNQRRLNALAKVEAILPTVQAAAASTDLNEALELWGRVFGPAFPAPSTSDEAVAKALKKRTATVSGTGVTALPTGRRPIPARSHGPARPKS